ncbi:MAG TPA: magnesium transporter [Castellaniella sp.]|nr:magnesium transporter [Castellaniella sp.]
MNERSLWEKLLEDVRLRLEQEPVDEDAVARLLRDQAPAEVALVLEGLDPADAVKAFNTLQDACAAHVLTLLAPELTTTITATLAPDRLAGFIDQLPSRDAAVLLSDQSKRAIEESTNAGLIGADVVREAAQQQCYPEGTVGRMMTQHFVRLDPAMTLRQALAQVPRSDPKKELPNDMQVVRQEEVSGRTRERLLGVISIRDALMQPGDRLVADAMEEQVVCVSVDTESTSAARLLSKHKFLSLPVTDRDGFLVGVVPQEDLMQVTIAKLYERYSGAVGTDAAAMEAMSPVQAAKTRLPWLFGTMVIEMAAALLIDQFDAILKQVILLAAFMPVISAVSGNVGLQAAAITVRKIDMGTTSTRAAMATVVKEVLTTVMMAVACGAVLGTIGGFWSTHFMFGVVIGVALTCSMVTAAFMGTLFPIISKRMGFDPATTAGPFETAFQDVIGFGVFLGMATLLSAHL